MFTSKNAIVGIAAAAVASVLLVAGFTVTGTSGAETDFTPPSSIEIPDNTGNPPASDIEDPGAGADPTGGSPVGTTDPTGGQAGQGANPAALPDAGVGGNDGGFSMLAVLLAVGGLALVGAGATTVAIRRS